MKDHVKISETAKLQKSWPSTRGMAGFWKTRKLIYWLIDWLTDWLIDWLIDWLTDWLIDWLIDWFTDWLTDWLIDWLINLESRCLDNDISCPQWKKQNYCVTKKNYMAFNCKKTCELCRRKEQGKLHMFLFHQIRFTTHQNDHTRYHNFIAKSHGLHIVRHRQTDRQTDRQADRHRHRRRRRRRRRRSCRQKQTGAQTQTRTESTQT